MTGLLGCKRGQLRNYLVIIVFFVMFGFLSIMGYLLYDSFVTELDSAGLLASDGAKKAKAGFDVGMNMFDVIMVIMLAAFVLLTGVTSFRLATSAVFYVLTLLGAAFLGFISYLFNHIFVEMAVNSGAFNSVLGHFPITLLICTNLHWVMLLLIIVGSVTFFGKPKEASL